MNNKGEIKLYNILFPLWIIIFLPSLLWLLLIPANYFFDRIVLWYSLGKKKDKGNFCKKHTWKICLAGFLSDFIGALFLFIMLLGTSMIGAKLSGENFFDNVSNGIGFNPFSNVVALLIVLLSIFVAGLLIYFIDKKILSNGGLKGKQLKKSALMLALITAPYLYLFPSILLYNS